MTEYDKNMYKSCRETANLTQNEACYHLDIKDVLMLSRYENGHITPSDSLVKDMAKLYRDKNLVSWHLRRIHPDLCEYIPYPKSINSIFAPILFL